MAGGSGQADGSTGRRGWTVRRDSTAGGAGQSGETRQPAASTVRLVGRGRLVERSRRAGRGGRQARPATPTGATAAQYVGGSSAVGRVQGVADRQRAPQFADHVWQVADQDRRWQGTPFVAKVASAHDFTARGVDRSAFVYRARRGRTRQTRRFRSAHEPFGASRRCTGARAWPSSSGPRRRGDAEVDHLGAAIVSMTFAGLMSRCTTPSRWAALSAPATPAHT